MDNKLEATFLDAALHLLDRQVVDVEKLHVCKVDDLELSFAADGSAAVTRILTGPAAWVPRLSSRNGHWLRERWHSLGVQYAGRDVPLAVPLDAIAHVGSAVELAVHREGLLDRQPPAADGVERRRLGELLGLRVNDGHPELRGKVLDLRLEPGTTRYRVTHLLVGPGRPGSLLGYDRGDFNGPWLVNTAVSWLHRHIRLVPWEAVERLDWEEGVVSVDAGADAVHPVDLDR